jgi:hypothetical protein
MAKEKEKVQELETTKPGDGKQAELSDQELKKVAGGIAKGGKPL